MSYHKFAKDAVTMGLAQMITALSAIIILPIITKILGARSYGIWVELSVTISIIAPIAILGLPYTLVRFLSAEKDKESIQDGIWSVVTVVFATVAIISLFLIVFSEPISHFLGGEKLFVQILAVIIIFECINQVFANIFRAFQQIKMYSFYTIFQTIGNATLITLTISLGYGLLGAVLSLLIVDTINFLIMATLVIKRVGIKIPRFLKIREHLSFSLPTIMGNVSFWIVQSSDRYLIGFFLGALFVGYYSPAYTLSGIILFFVAPLSLILLAALSKSYAENKIREVKNYIKYSIKYFLLLAIPSSFGLSILSKQLLTIFSTSEIAQNSYYIVPFIVLSMISFGIYSIVAEILSLKKKTHIGGIIWLLAALLNFGLNFIFIPRFGILGAAITTFLAYTFVGALNCYYSYKELQFEVDWLAISKIAVASVLMSLFVFWFNPVGFYKTIFAIILGASIYLTLILLFRIFSKKELDFLNNILKNLVPSLAGKKI